MCLNQSKNRVAAVGGSRKTLKVSEPVENSVVIGDAGSGGSEVVRLAPVLVQVANDRVCSLHRHPDRIVIRPRMSRANVFSSTSLPTSWG